MIDKEKLGTYDAIKSNIETQAVEQYKKGLLEWLQANINSIADEIDKCSDNPNRMKCYTTNVYLLNGIMHKIQSGDLDKAVEYEGN